MSALKIFKQAAASMLPVVNEDQSAPSRRRGATSQVRTSRHADGARAVGLYDLERALGLRLYAACSCKEKRAMRYKTVLPWQPSPQEIAA